MVSSVRTPHGSSKTRSSHVRIQPCSGDWALVRSRRSISLAMKFLALSAASSVSSFVRYSPTTSSSPSPSSLRIAASCWRSRYSRCCLSTPSVTSLRMVSATCSSARWSRAQASTSSTRVGDVDRGEHLDAALLGEVGPADDAVGEGAGLEAGAQQLGEAAGAAQLGDLLEDAAQLAGEGLDAGRRAGVAQDLGVGVGGAALGGVDGGDAGARLDADDGDRLAGRQGADVGHLGDDGQVGRRRRAAATRPSPALRAASTARRAWSVTRARVMTAPGRTVAGSSASGSRVAVGVATVVESLMDRRVSIHRPIASKLDTASTQVCWVGRAKRQRHRPSSRTCSRRAPVRHHEPRRVGPEDAPQPIAAPVEGQPAVARSVVTDGDHDLVARRSVAERPRNWMRWRPWSLQKNGTGAYGAGSPPAAVASRLRAASGALLGGVRPVLDAHLLAEQAVRPAAHVAGRLHARRPAASVASHTTPSRSSSPLPSSQPVDRRHPDADDDHVGRHQRRRRPACTPSSPSPATRTSQRMSMPSAACTAVGSAAHLGAEAADQRRRQALEHGHRAALAPGPSPRPRAR